MIVLLAALVVSGAALTAVLAVIARSGTELLDDALDCPDEVES